jgi:helix-turn-helix protein
MDIIGTNGFAVYAVLKKHENRHTGRCYPSYQTVADITHLDRKTVIKYTDILVKLGLITKQPHFIEGRQTSNRYSFCDLSAGNKRGGIVTPPQDRGESLDSPGRGVPPGPLPSEPTLTKRQQECPHEDTANLDDGVVYCRTCYANIEIAEEEEVARGGD